MPGENSTKLDEGVAQGIGHAGNGDNVGSRIRVTEREARIPEIEPFDALFAAWLVKNPGGRFSRFSTERVSAQMKQGLQHTTLGADLQGEADWRKNGVPFFRKLQSLVELPRNAKVVDYGCGSLRVGIHYIERQDPGCYFGLDVSQDFVDIGIKNAGDIMQTKRARAGSIDKCLIEAIDFSADMLFSANVACHVHPDEIDDFYGNMKALVTKPEGKILLHVMENKTMVRYHKSGWAWPLEAYDGFMQPFTRTKTHFIKDAVRGTRTLGSYILVYERA
jgi:SAM-dependent methyltransferase